MSYAGDNRTLKHGCIVMASGVGVRFGGNKLMAELCGEPLVGHVVRATDGLFDRRVVVTRHVDVAAVCETLGAQVIMHDEPGRNDTVRLGMEVMDGCDTVTFVQGDQPLIRPVSIAALLRAAERDATRGLSACIWRTSFDGMPGAPVLFPSWMFGELCSLPRGKGGGYVAKVHAECVRAIELSSEWELFDVDTRDDLQHLQAHIARCGSAGLPR